MLRICVTFVEGSHGGSYVFRGRREIRGVLRYCKAYSGIARGAPTGAACQWFSSLPKLQLCGLVPYRRMYTIPPTHSVYYFVPHREARRRPKPTTPHSTDVWFQIFLSHIRHGEGQQLFYVFVEVPASGGNEASADALVDIPKLISVSLCTREALPFGPEWYCVHSECLLNSCQMI